MKRYSMHATHANDVDEEEDIAGEWVRFEDAEQLRGNLSLAEEGLANYQQEMENAKHDIERLTAAASAEATEVQRLRKVLEDIASGEIGINLCVKYAKKALGSPAPQSAEHAMAPHK